MAHDTTSRSSPNEQPIKTTSHRKGGKGQAQVSASRPPFAPVPRALVRSPHVSAEAVRLWAVLDELAFEKVAPEVPVLQARLFTERPDKEGQIVRKVPSQASIYRWLKELTEAGFLEWDRNADLGERFKLLDGTPEGEATAVLRQLRGIMRQLQRATSAEEHEQALTAMAKILTGENSFLADENRTLTDENSFLTSENVFLTSEKKTPTNENPIHVYRDITETIETSSDTMPTHHPLNDDDVPTPTELFLQEENLGVARELRAMPLDLAQRYVADAKGRGASLPAIAKGLRACWKREQTRQREQAAALTPPEWLDPSSWPGLPAELQRALHDTTIDDEGFLEYADHHHDVITAHEATVKALMRQARAAVAVGE